MNGNDNKKPRSFTAFRMTLERLSLTRGIPFAWFFLLSTFYFLLSTFYFLLSTFYFLLFLHLQNHMQKQLLAHCLTIAWLSLNYRLTIAWLSLDNRFAWLMHEILHFTSFHSEWRWSRASCRRHPERSEGSHAESHAKTTACPLLNYRLTIAWQPLCMTYAWDSSFHFVSFRMTVE